MRLGPISWGDVAALPRFQARATSGAIDLSLPKLLCRGFVRRNIRLSVPQAECHGGPVQLAEDFRTRRGDKYDRVGSS